MNVSKFSREFVMIFAFCILSIAGFSQICIDGDYCPNPTGGDPAGNCADPTVVDEWASAFDSVFTGASGSCEFAEIFVTVIDGTLYMAIVKGNEGAAHFFAYFDTDCDPTTGDLAHGGADKVLQFRVRQSGNPSLEILGVRCWDAASGDFGPLMGGGIGMIADGASDACGGVDLNFVEMSYPIEGVFDPCQEGCSSVTLTWIESVSGWSENSSFCDAEFTNFEIPVNEIPTADFNFPPGPICVGESVIYDATSSIDNIPVDDVLTYCWDIDYPGSGPIVCDDTNPIITVTYNTAGIYQIALVVEDSYGCMDTAFIVTDMLEVVEAPVAAGTVTLDPCTLELTYDGSASLDGGGLDNLEFQWDFGDGGISTTETGTYTYADCAGTGIVTLIITDPDIASPDCQMDTIMFPIVYDTTPPIVTCPPAVTVGCTDPIPTFTSIADFLAAGGTIVDDCAGVTIAITNEVVSVGTCPVSQVITYTYEIADLCGNVGSCDFEVNVVTDQLPVILTCPPDVILECGMSTDTADLGVPVFEPNPCGINLVVVDVVMGGSCPDEMEIMRTFTAVDPCLGDVSCVQIIMITDPTPPMFDDPIPADLLVECAADVPPPPIINMTDNCGSMFMIMPVDVILPGTCPNDFILQRTWSMADPCGNIASATQTITVSDVTPPTIDDPIPADLIVNCAVEIPAGLDLNVSDNCGGPDLVSPVDVTISMGVCVNDVLIERTWTYADECGNEVSATQTIESVSIPPTFDGTAPVDLMLECASDIPAPIDLPVTDNCDGADIVSPVDVTVSMGTCLNDIVIERTWEYTNSCDFTISMMQTITVLDITMPVFDPAPPADVEVECAADVPAPIDIAWTDNCGGSGTASPVDVILPGGCPNRFTVERTWTAIDECLNEFTHTQIIAVDDITPPLLVCQDVTVDFEGNPNVVLVPDDFIVSVSDNCGAFTITADPPEFHCSDILPDTTAMVEIIATDDCGNEFVCIANITFINFAPMELFCPGDTTIFLGPGECNAVVPYIVSGINPCGDPPIITQIDTSGYTTGDGFPIGTTFQEYMATNEFGDTLTCSFNITVIENDDPNDALVCNDLVNISVDQNCMVEITGDVILEGNNYGCEDSLIITIFTIYGDTVLNPITFDPDYSPTNNNYVVCVTDPNSGNTCCGEIHLEDKLDPAIQCPCPPGAWMTDPACQRTCLNINQIMNGQIGQPDVSDNCVGVVPVFGGANLIEQAECGAYIVEQFWSLTTDVYDGQNFPEINCTNEYYISPVDISLVTVPPDVVIDCTDSGNTDITHPDNTGYPRLGGDLLDSQDQNPFCNIYAAYTDVEIPSCGTECGNVMKVARFWTIVDWCTGVTEEFYQLIKVADDEGPTIQMEDVYTSTNAWKCSADIWFTDPQLHDNCSYDLDWYIVSTNSGATLVDVNGQQNSNNPKQHALNVPKGTWEFVIGSTDCCGNLGSTTINVTVADLTAPVPVAKEYITVSLTSGGLDPDGIAKIFYTSLDEGSHDNCTDVFIEIRRETDACGINGNSTYSNKIPAICDPWYNSNDHDYGELVKFCCEDLTEVDGDAMYGMVKVWMRVWDDANMDGEYGSYTYYDNPGNDHDYCEFDDNFNEVWSWVRVENKTEANLICPPDITIPCDWDYTDLSITGSSAGSTTCGTAEVMYEDWADIHCGEGYVLREWSIPGYDYKCTQTITITPIITPLEVVCPVDPATQSNKVIVDCADYDIPEPWVSSAACSLTGISSDIDTFWFEAGACYKVIKTWRIVDWCSGEEVFCDFTVSLIDTDAPMVTCQDTCIGVDDFWDADGDGNTCEFANNIILTNSAGDDGDCGSEWIKWLIQVDYWGDGVVEYEGSSFVPHNSSNYVAPTQSGADVSVSLNKNAASAEWARHIIKWKAFDGCGNVNQCTQVLEVGDKKAPTPYCIEISTALMDTDPPLVEIWAIDFNADSFDNCTAKNQLLYTFDQVSPVFSKITQTHCFDESGEVPCSQYENGFPIQKWNPATRSSGTKFIGLGYCGINELRVSVWDNKENTDYCRVSLIIHGGACDAMVLPMERIAGNISTENDDAIQDVDVELMTDNPEYPRNFMTLDDGNYAFDDNIMYTHYDIYAEKSDSYLNGVSTLDLVFIQRHILGLQEFDSHYKSIAADANNDFNVSGIDLVEIRKLILGIYEELPENKSWRFVDPEYTEEIDAPFPFAETIKIDHFSESELNENFIGIKIGDVNGTASVNFSSINSENRSGEKLEFILDYADDGSIIFKAGKNFTNVYGFQFNGEFTGDLYDLQAENLNLNDNNFVINNNTLAISYSSSEAVSFVEGETLFSLSGNLNKAVLLPNARITNEAYIGNELKLTGIEFRILNKNGNSVNTTLYQNTPNPFSATTTISFDQAEKAVARISIIDVSGKVLKVIEEEFEQGFNSVLITKKELNATGVLYYRYESGIYTNTKKMIVLD